MGIFQGDRISGLRDLGGSATSGEDGSGTPPWVGSQMICSLAAGPSVGNDRPACLRQSRKAALSVR